MRRHLMLLVNPNAGKGMFREALGDICQTLYAGGWVPDVFFTDGANRAPALVEKNAGKYDLVACIGGDGTLSEVVSGLMRIDDPPPIGYIPMGTANDVASTLALPKDPVEAARRVVGGTPIPYDVGAFGTQSYFTYISAFGAFTDVSYKTPQENKQALGHLAYLLEGMTRLPKLTHHMVRVEYDGGTLEEDLVFGSVSNSTSVAGLVKLDNRLVGLDDGLFEIMLIRNPRSVADLNGIITGILTQNYSKSQVTLLKSRFVRFTFDEPVAWTRDGEDGGYHNAVELRNIPSAVKIIV